MKLNGYLKASWTAAWATILILVSSPAEVNAQTCVSCAGARITVKTTGTAPLECTIPVDPSAESSGQPGGLMRVFKARWGTPYNVNLAQASGCEASVADVSACTNLFYKVKTPSGWPSLWQMGRSYSLRVSPPPCGYRLVGGTTGVSCDCEDCTHDGVSCRCSCYHEVGSTFDNKYYLGYLAYGFHRVEITVLDNPQWQEQVEAYQSHEDYLGIDWAVDGNSVDVVFKDMVNLVQVAHDSRLPFDAQNPAHSRFVRWDPTTEQTETVTTSTTVYCQCAPPGQVTGGVVTYGPTGDGGPPANSIVMAWKAPTDNGLECGQVVATGADNQGATGDANTDVPVNLEFGLGGNTEGASMAMFTFSASLDDPDILNTGNFTLTTPFQSAENAAVKLNPSFAPVAEVPSGSVFRLGANGLNVFETRTATTVRLEFHDTTRPTGSQLVAVNTLQKVAGTANTMPGLIVTEERNGRTLVYGFYGQSDGNGGRTWKTVSPDDTIQEGSDSSWVDNIRYEEKTDKHLVDGLEEIIRSTTTKLEKFDWGERRMEVVESIPGGESRTTQYAYYGLADGNLKGLLKWQKQPDGSWEKYIYNTSNGALLQRLRPWLSEVANPQDATPANSEAITYVTYPDLGEWEIKSVKGVVVSRSKREENKASLGPLVSSAWGWESKVYQTTLAVPDQVEGDLSGHVVRLAVGGVNYTEVALADFGGSISRALSHLSKGIIAYDSTTGKYFSHGVAPVFYYEKPGPLIPGVPAFRTFRAFDGYDNDLTIKVDGVPVISQFYAEGSAATKASALYSALSGAIQNFNNKFVVEMDNTTLDVTIRMTSPGIGGIKVTMILDELNPSGGAFQQVDYFAGSDNASPPIVHGSNWTFVTPQSSGESGTPLGVSLFDGNYSITKTQQFTPDYKAWTGNIEIREAANANQRDGDLVGTVDSSGNVKHYTRVKGTFNKATKQFTWSGSGDAVKTTIKTYAAEPSTFVLMELHPLHQVTMEDGEGKTWVEETWKGEDLIERTTHDYDEKTGELLTTWKNEIEVYKAERNTAANTLTEIDASGVVTVTTFTSDGRVEKTEKVVDEGNPALNIVSRTIEDGLTTISETSAAGLRLESSSVRDGFGRSVSETDQNGLVTSYTYAESGRRSTVVDPGGGTRITENHLDGSSKFMAGTAVVPRYHVREYDSQGNRVETVYLGDDGSSPTRSPRWHRTVTNSLGWLLKEERPAVGGAGVVAAQHQYDLRGNRVRSGQFGGPAAFTSFDRFGRSIYTGLDLNSNGVFELHSNELSSGYQYGHEEITNKWWEVTRVTSYNGALEAPLGTAIERRLLGTALGSEVVGQQPDGTTISTSVAVNRTAKSATVTLTSNKPELHSQRVSSNGLLVSESLPGASSPVVYEYDGLERLVVTTSSDQVKRRTVYDDAMDGLARSRVLRVETKPAGASGYATEVAHSYVPQGTPGAGQIASSTRADGSILNYSYDLHSRQQFVGGSGTWPIRYEYDSFGALWKMHTYRTGSPGVASEGDLTVWQRDPATGTLLNKEDALGNSTSYVPEAATGRLTQRQWMRATGGQRLTTAYQYNAQGLLLSVDYSDATPDVVNTFDAAGRLTSTQDAAGSHSHSYSGPAGAWSGETVTGGLLPGLVLAKTFDASGRKTAFTWTFAGESRTINYGYDTAGRLATVTAFGHSATYSYSGTDGKKTGLTYAGSPGLNGEWVYDSRGRVESTNWKRGIETLLSNQYAYDAMNRRISAAREDGQQWRYAYNDRGEVGSAVKAMSTDAQAGLRNGLQTSYSYDLMGNRSGMTTHTPTGLETLIWLHNGVNQLTSRQTPSGTWVRGRLHEDAVLGTIVGGGTPSRSGTTFDIPVALNDQGQSQWRLLEMNASRQGTGVNGGEVRQKRTSHLWLQGSPEALTYDLDGNLTGDGRWQYEWDGENRLKAMQTGSTALAAGVPGVRMEFSYDSQGRRVRKLRKDLAAAIPVTVSDLRFIYDNWNLMAEFECVSGTPVLVRAYSWGLDLSGTEQGAGGVGGLVSMQDAATAEVFGACYDANGNVVAYSSLTTGGLALTLDYDAFGAVVEEERLAAASKAVQFPFRFSTKYEDESGLNYYGFRYYSPEIGKWLSKDPIGERGGSNLYCMVENDLLNHVDNLGLSPILAEQLAREYVRNLAERLATGNRLIAEARGKIVAHIFGSDNKKIAELMGLSGGVARIMGTQAQGILSVVSPDSKSAAYNRLTKNISLFHLDNPPEKILHEFVHKWNDDNNAAVFGSLDDEGAAYLVEAYYVSLPVFAEQLGPESLRTIARPPRNGGAGGCGRAVQNMTRRWQLIWKMYGTLDKWNREIGYGFGGLSTGNFRVLDFTNVDAHFGIRLSCQKLADYINNHRELSKCCIRVSCGTGGIQAGGEHGPFTIITPGRSIDGVFK